MKLILAGILCVPAFLLGQVLPDAPSSIRTGSPPATISAPRLSGCRPGFCTTPQHSVWTMQNKISETLKWAALIADIETTAHALEAGCREANPMFGDHPSRAKMYGVMVPVTALHSFVGYRLAKHNPKSKFWKVGNFIGAGGHGVAAIHNTSCF